MMKIEFGTSSRGCTAMRTLTGFNTNSRPGDNEKNRDNNNIERICALCEPKRGREVEAVRILGRNYLCTPPSSQDYRINSAHKICC